MYSKRSISLKISSRSGFGGGENESIEIKNPKCALNLGFGSIDGSVTAEAHVFGLSTRVMSMLTARGIGRYQVDPSDLTIEIYVDGHISFSGIVVQAFSNANTAPETTTSISAISTGELKFAAIKPTSISGQAPVSDILSDLCKQGGFLFEPYGLGGLVETNPNYSGSALSQIKNVCINNNIAFCVHLGAVVAWSRGSKTRQYTPEISKNSGLIGYPVFGSYGVQLQTTYTNKIFVGVDFNLITDVPNLSGEYNAVEVSHSLTTWTNGGSWNTIISGVRKNEA